MKRLHSAIAKVFLSKKSENVKITKIRKRGVTENQEAWETDVEDELPATEVPLDDRILVVSPDGGWGWAVVVASLLSNFVVEGTLYNIGQIFQPIWMAEFKTNVSATAWVVSITVAWINFAGPIAGCLINMLGCRMVGFIGAFLTTIGFISSMPAKSVVHLYFTFGFIGGTGLGLIGLSSIIVVNYYFEKKRALATGIAICGSGLGTLAFGPLLADVLVTELGRAGGLRKLSNAIIMKVNSPMNRKDIFYRSSSTLLKRQMSVQALEAIVEELTEEEPEPIVFTSTVWNVLNPFKMALTNLLDVKLVCSPTYLAWAIQGMLFCFVSMVPFIYLPQRAVLQGHSEQYATLLVSCIGAVNIVCRILCGWVSDMPSVNPVNLQNRAILIAATATLLVPLLHSYWLLIVYCVFFAFGLDQSFYLLACFAVLRSITAVQLFGLAKLTNAVGLSMVLFGIAGLFGPPFAGTFPPL
ncbi:unnamed protein product [Soboliphyme baturini]|uniref:MFS domain-containing protein n=1 Tax=Soboliphyme baturini TaxID=241478 RepID=A0A183IC14_9BILA|nr:unnamed protein product [Soboliphyme baturini]